MSSNQVRKYKQINVIGDENRDAARYMGPHSASSASEYASKTNSVKGYPVGINSGQKVKVLVKDYKTHINLIGKMNRKQFQEDHKQLEQVVVQRIQPTVEYGTVGRINLHKVSAAVGSTQIKRSTWQENYQDGVTLSKPKFRYKWRSQERDIQSDQIYNNSHVEQINVLQKDFFQRRKAIKNQSSSKEQLPKSSQNKFEMSEGKYALPMAVNMSIDVSDYHHGQRDLINDNHRPLRSSSLQQTPEVTSNKRFEPSETTNYLKGSMLRKNMNTIQIENRVSGQSITDGQESNQDSVYKEKIDISYRGNTEQQIDKNKSQTFDHNRKNGPKLQEISKSNHRYIKECAATSSLSKTQETMLRYPYVENDSTEKSEVDSVKMYDLIKNSEAARPAVLCFVPTPMSIATQKEIRESVFDKDQNSKTSIKSSILKQKKELSKIGSVKSVQTQQRTMHVNLREKIIEDDQIQIQEIKMETFGQQQAKSPGFLRESNKSQEQKQQKLHSFQPFLSNQKHDSQELQNVYSDALTQSQNWVRYTLDQDNVQSQNSEEEEQSATFKRQKRNMSNQRQKVKFEKSASIQESRVSVTNDAYLGGSSQHTASAGETCRQRHSKQPSSAKSTQDQYVLIYPQVITQHDFMRQQQQQQYRREEIQEEPDHEESEGAEHYKNINHREAVGNENGDQDSRTMIKHDISNDPQYCKKCTNWYENQQDCKSDRSNTIHEYADGYGGTSVPQQNQLFYISSELSKQGIEEKEANEQTSRKSENPVTSEKNPSSNNTAAAARALLHSSNNPIAQFQANVQNKGFKELSSILIKEEVTLAATQENFHHSLKSTSIQCEMHRSQTILNQLDKQKTIEKQKSESVSSIMNIKQEVSIEIGIQTAPQFNKSSSTKSSLSAAINSRKQITATETADIKIQTEYYNQRQEIQPKSNEDHLFEVQVKDLRTEKKEIIGTKVDAEIQTIQTQYYESIFEKQIRQHSRVTDQVSKKVENVEKKNEKHSKILNQNQPSDILEADDQIQIEKNERESISSSLNVNASYYNNQQHQQQYIATSHFPSQTPVQSNKSNKKSEIGRQNHEVSNNSRRVAARDAVASTVSRAVRSENSTISNNLQKRATRQNDIVPSVSFDKESKVFQKPRKQVQNNNGSEFSRKYKQVKQEPIQHRQQLDHNSMLQNHRESMQSQTTVSQQNSIVSPQKQVQLNFNKQRQSNMTSKSSQPQMQFTRDSNQIRQTVLNFQQPVRQSIFDQKQTIESSFDGDRSKSRERQQLKEQSINSQQSILPKGILLDEGRKSNSNEKSSNQKPLLKEESKMKFYREAQMSAQQASRVKLGEIRNFEHYYDIDSQPSKVNLSEMEYLESLKQNHIQIEESALVQQRQDVIKEKEQIKKQIERLEKHRENRKEVNKQRQVLLREQEQLRAEIVELDQLKSLLIIKKNEGKVFRLDQLGAVSEFDQQITPIDLFDREMQTVNKKFETFKITQNQFFKTNSNSLSETGQTEFTTKTKPAEFQQVITEGEEEKAKIVDTAMSTHTTSFMPLGGVFDWAQSKLMDDLKYKVKLYSPTDMEGNYSTESYNEQEILELIEMVKDGEEDIKKPQFVNWLFSKSFMTLSTLMSYMNQQALLPLVHEKYRQCSLQNSVKILVRCKQLLVARKLLYKTLQNILMFEKCVQSVRDYVDIFLDYKTPEKPNVELKKKITNLCRQELALITQSIIDNVVILRDHYHLFSKMRAISTKGRDVLNVMAWKRRDAMRYVIREYQSIKRLVQVADVEDLPNYQCK